MSRSGYTDDDDGDYPLALWRGAVASSINGKRGQAFLRETLAALDAMPVKELVPLAFEHDGQFCTLGVVGARRGVDLQPFIDDGYDEPEVDHDALACALGVAAPLVREVMFLNDEMIHETRWVEKELCGPLRPWDDRFISVREPHPEAEARRWRYMHDWVASHIREPKP